jgi:hypothetical protein
VDTDSNVLLALIAVRMAGAGGLSAKADAARILKKPILTAAERGLLAEADVPVPAPTAKEPDKTKTTKGYTLTDAGERLLRDATAPGAAEAAATAARAEVRRRAEVEQRKEVAALLQRLDADRAALRQRVESALPKKAKGEDAAKIQREVEKLARAVVGIADRLQKLEHALTGGVDADQLLRRIDEAVTGLRDRAPDLPPAPPPRPAPAAAPLGPGNAPPAIPAAAERPTVREMGPGVPVDR